MLPEVQKNNKPLSDNHRMGEREGKKTTNMTVCQSHGISLLQTNRKKIYIVPGSSMCPVVKTTTKKNS